MNEPQPLHVVAAIIVQEDKLLACRRASHKASPGLWEFPGGKVELGESPQLALSREIEEELGVRCTVLRAFDLSDTVTGDTVIRLETALCELDTLSLISSTDHDSIIWVGAAEALKLRWAEPDLPALHKLIQLQIIR